MQHKKYFNPLEVKAFHLKQTKKTIYFHRHFSSIKQLNNFNGKLLSHSTHCLTVTFYHLL